MLSRAQRTPFGEWWWTVDRLALAAIGALMLAGVVLSLAASPPVAARLGLDPFFFVNRHVLYLLPAIAVMLGVSFLNPRQIRRVSLVIFLVSLIMVAATPYFGPEIKGARRWLVLLGINIQPSPGYPTHYIEWHTCLSLAFQAHLVSLLTEGVFERFPNFRIVLVEGGTAWLPGLMWRLDAEWKALRTEVPWMKRRPSEYLRDHVRLTTQPVEQPDNDRYLLQHLEHGFVRSAVERPIERRDACCHRRIGIDL